MRRSLIATIVAGAVFGATFLSLDPAAAATSYDDYVLFGENGVVVGHDSTVTGLVGARHNTAGGAESLNMTGGSRIIGDARAGADVRMQNNTSISGTLHRVGNYIGHATATVGTNVQVADADLPTAPIPRQWPGGAAGAATHCAADNSPDYVLGGNGHSVTLVPGTYGTIDLNAQSHLTFAAAGDYFVDQIWMANGTTLNFADGARIFVCTWFKVGNGTFNGPANPAGLYVEVQGKHAADDNHGFEIGNLDWVGNIVVPNGGVHIGAGGSQASITGHVWADYIDLEHSVEVVDTTTTTTSTSTSTSTTVPDTTTTSTSTSSTTSTSTTSTTVPDTTTTSTSTSTSTSTTVPETTTTSTSSTSTSTTSTSTTSTSTTSTTVPDTTTTSTSTSSSSTTSTTVPETTTTTVADTTTTTVADTTTTTVADSTTTTVPSSSTTVGVLESTTTTSSESDGQGATIPTTTTTTRRSTGRLPITGSDALAQLCFGLSLLAGGALLAFRGRRDVNEA